MAGLVPAILAFLLRRAPTQQAIMKTLLAALLAATLSTAVQAAPLYHLTATIPLGGGLKWDYLRFDPATDRLYVSHGTEVTIVSLRTNKIIGELKNLPGSHGIAIDPATGAIYADSAANAQAIAFNPKNFAPVAAASVVLDADAVVYDPSSKKIYVNGGDGMAITPIDPITNKAEPNIALPGAPEFFAADGAGALYENIESTSQLVRIDTATDKITATWPLAPCAHPKGLAIDPTQRIIFSSCANGVMAATNADTGAQLATIPIGQHTDAAAFDPIRHRAFSSNGDGTLTIISDAGGHIALLATLKTAPGARTMAIDPTTGRLFLVTATVTGLIPPDAPGASPKFKFAPGTLHVLVYAPSK